MSQELYSYQGDIAKFWKTTPPMVESGNRWTPTDFFYCIDVDNKILGVVKRGDNTFLTIDGLTKYVETESISAIKPILLDEYNTVPNPGKSIICFTEVPIGHISVTTVGEALRSNPSQLYFITTHRLYEAGLKRLGEEAVKCFVEQVEAVEPTSDKFIKVTALERRLDISEPVYVLRGYKVEEDLFVENMLAVGFICEGADDNSKSVEFREDCEIPLESLYVRA